MQPNNDYEVFNEEIEFKLKEISDWIGAQLPEGWAYTLFINSTNETPTKMFFMTNLQKDDMLRAVDKFVAIQREKSDPKPPETNQQ